MPKPIALIAFIFIFNVLVISGFLVWKNSNQEFLSPQFFRNVRQRNLSKYSFENLAKQKFSGNDIKLEKVIKVAESHTSYQFSFKNDENKKVTGLLNVPKKPRDNNPLILMIRGYQNKTGYVTGNGTKNAASVFASNGYYTISPDFLGFAESDPDSPDILEARFEKPATVLSLLASIQNHQIIPMNNGSSFSLRNSPLSIWAHSNGGQITLSILEITGKSIPVSLWAPVSVGFPFSVTNYLSSRSESDNYTRRELVDFATRYKYDDYSIDKYFGQINAPVQLQQGSKDLDVPQAWSDNLAKTLDLNLNSDYFVYPRSDHNISQDWDIAIKRDLSFYEKHSKGNLSSN